MTAPASVPVAAPSAVLLAVLLAAAAAALAVRPPQEAWPVPSGAWGPDDHGAPGRRSSAPRRRGARSAVLVVAAVATWAVTSSVLSGTHLAVVAVAVGAGLAAARSVATRRQAEEARRRRRAVVDFCEALVGELRAGQPSLLALERSAAVWPEVGPAVSAAHLDADLPAALRRLADAPGAEAVHHLAVAWQLSAATGGSLAVATGHVLEAARADAEALHQVEGEVSSARATARLVALLPVVVLVAGQGLGARPWAFLLGHPVGVACLAAGVALLVAGTSWIDRIAASATSSRG